MAIQVRDASRADLEAVGSIFRRASLTNDGDRDALLAHPEALTFGAEALAAGRVRLAVDGQHVLGFATTAEHNGTLELVDLFVDPEHVRRGVATTLIDDAVAHALSVGATAIGVDANPHAFGFYAAVGFAGDAEVATEFGVGRRLVLDVAARVAARERAPDQR